MGREAALKLSCHLLATDWTASVLRHVRTAVYVARYLKQPLDHVMQWPPSDLDLYAYCAAELVGRENKPPS